MKRFIFILYMMVSPHTTQPDSPVRKVGRPKSGTEKQRHDLLLVQAMDLLLREGVANTSMARIAAHCGVSTRTLYQHYENKYALMIAAMKHMVEQDAIILGEIGQFKTQPLAQVLTEIGRFILKRVLEPRMLSFFKVGLTEVGNYPEIARQMKSVGPERIFQLLADIFTVYADNGQLPRVNFILAAESYCELLVSGPRMKALFGGLAADWDAEAHIQFVVALFLKGISGMEQNHG